ncbi:MAG: hypothetical protein GXO48_09175 [Chlorobi bacterium]|nr:hypothetical protein [Chlorobiota bacterium]
MGFPKTKVVDVATLFKIASVVLLIGFLELIIIAPLPLPFMRPTLLLTILFLIPAIGNKTLALILSFAISLTVDLFTSFSFTTSTVIPIVAFLFFPVVERSDVFSEMPFPLLAFYDKRRRTMAWLWLLILSALYVLLYMVISTLSISVLWVMPITALSFFVITFGINAIAIAILKPVFV